MNYIDYLPKLLLASLIGYLVGWERSSRKNSQIGIGTTSILVTGATLLTIISKYGLGSDGDPSRLISNIITAVGFLCSGVIFMKAKDDDQDRELVGLTTSVTLFSLTGVGIAIGLGFYELAISATLIVEINILLSRLRKKVRYKRENFEEDDEQEE